MDAKLIDIDNFNWEKPHNYAIINNVLMDRNLMGNRIQGITHILLLVMASGGAITCVLFVELLIPTKILSWLLIIIDPSAIKMQQMVNPQFRKKPAKFINQDIPQ
jgi:hypothetical protein